MKATVSQRWFSIGSRGEPQADPDPEWSRERRERQCCPECKELLPEFAGRPINAVLRYEPDSAPVMGMGAESAWIARLDFLQCFKGLMEDYLVLGTVHDRSGTSYPEYATYTAPFALPIRGRPESILGHCSRCGSLRYFPMPFGYRYLFAGDLAPDRLLYSASICPLIVAEDVLGRIDLRTRRRLKVKEIPLRDAPEDGIAEFPTCYL